MLPLMSFIFVLDVRLFNAWKNKHIVLGGGNSICFYYILAQA